MKSVFLQNTCLYSRHKTENIFSKFDQNLKFFDAIEKKAARVGTKKCTPTSLFHVFFMIFNIFKGCIVGRKRRVIKKTLKRYQKRQNSLLFVILGSSKRSKGPVSTFRLYFFYSTLC